jgi:hypothetical protein
MFESNLMFLVVTKLSASFLKAFDLIYILHIYLTFAILFQIILSYFIIKQKDCNLFLF